MKDQEDVSQLSAFAVYNKLIPGVKSFTANSAEDTNSKKRKKGKRKLDEVQIVKTSTAVASARRNLDSNMAINSTKKIIAALKNIQGQESSIIPLDSEKLTKSQKKRNRKRKSKEQAKSNGIDIDSSSMPSNSKVAKLDAAPATKKTSNGLPKFLPNPLAIGGSKKVKGPRPDSGKEKEDRFNEAIQVNGSASTSIRSDTRPKKSAVSKQSKQQITSYIVNEKVNDGTSISSLLNRKPVWDSIEHGKSLLEWLIHPISVNTFMTEYWEKKPLHIKRSDKTSDYYQWLISSEKVDGILRQNVLKYQKNIDITSYSKSNNVRETQSDELEGRARPAVVWDYYNNGCSIRILNPQTYVKPLWRLNASLQEYFGSFVGANVYLTPPDSQGFAPHYDDIEAFILQVEGKKHWKLYKPRSKNEVLPRFSSNNFSEERDNLGKPILDVVVEEGDLLYFPRGTIHQAMASEDVHSLHITLSCQQKNSWGDLLKEHLNNVVDKAMAADVEFRKGLPVDYLSYMGIAHQDSHDLKEKRRKFGVTVKHLVDKLSVNAADFAADQMGKKFIWDSLPPYLGPKEKEVTVHEDGEFLQEGVVFNRCEMDPDVEIKLVRKNCVRLVVEEGVVRLYFTTENSKVYHEEEAQYLEMSAKTAPAVQYLMRCYPEFVKIDDLPISADDVSEKVQVAADLWERGLLMTRTPLETADGDGMGEFNSDDAESIGDESVELASEDEVPDTDDENFLEFSDTEGSDEDVDEDSDMDNDDSFNNESNEDSEESEDDMPVPILVKRKVPAAALIKSKAKNKN